MGEDVVKVEVDEKNDKGDEKPKEPGEEKDKKESLQGSCWIRWRCFLFTFLLLAFLIACLVLALPLLQKVAFGRLSCAPKERGSREVEGINLMGRTAQQVQPKVDGGKVEACSMYHWKRAERKERASIYYRGGDIYKGEVSGLQGGPNAISRYVGPDDNTLPEGWGEMQYEDGSSYLGDWVGGLREGCGVLVGPGETSRYLGSWRQDRKTGWGSLQFDNGAHYKGEFVDGKFHGQGSLTWESGHTYTGQFLYGVKEGRGTLTYPDNSRYSGTWQRGQPIGRGLLTLSPGKCLQVVWQIHDPITQFVPC